MKSLVESRTESLNVISVSDSEADYLVAAEVGIEFALIKRFARNVEFNKTFQGNVFETLSEFYDHVVSTQV